ncbi:MAG: hypothetical protein IPJ34_35070 [Myxococcales bacterium]|nr:hypothetical protein [Myxococcales bacterium]
MGPGALVVFGLVLSLARLGWVVFGLEIDARAFVTVVRKLILTADLDRARRLCAAVSTPMTDATAALLVAPIEGGREGLEQAFLRAFQARTRRVRETLWVPPVSAVALGAGALLGFAQGGPRWLLIGAVVGGGALVLTGFRLARMLSAATATRDELIELLLSSSPYRGQRP